MDSLIEKREIGDYVIEIHNDADPECPLKSWDMVGKYLFEYSNSNRLHNVCDYKDLFNDNNHSLEDAIRSIVCRYVDQKKIVEYLKRGKDKAFKLEYDKSSCCWKLKAWSLFFKKWSVMTMFDSSEIHNFDYRYELIEYLDKEDLIELIEKCAKDIVVKEWDSRGYSQGDYVEGIAYVTKDNFDKICGRKDKDWRECAKECVDEEVKALGMWLWGDVKGFILKKKVRFTKKYEDKNREDEDDYELEEVDSCWGYYMETEDLIEEVIKEHNLK